LAHFNAINANPPPESAEVLKRAGLVMALTAWETYVEDRVIEGTNARISAVSGSFLGDFITKKLNDEMRRFNTPNAENTKRIFLEYLGVDVTAGWSWENTDPDTAKKSLNLWISTRGEAVHRSKPINFGAPTPHLVKREDLEKVIRFVRGLVKATDSHLACNL
jgi:hypothetical protein